jgi:tetratricopeptide (TPR) repeat protein
LSFRFSLKSVDNIGAICQVLPLKSVKNDVLHRFCALIAMSSLRFAEDVTTAFCHNEKNLNFALQLTLPGTHSRRIMLSKPIVKPSLVVLLVMLSATPSYASQSEAVQQIMELLHQQSPDQAFALAIANQAELEGDPDFDYAFAVAAKQSGNLDQAVFAFERVLQVQPNAYDARFGLALSYYELGNLDAAKQELSVLPRALGTNSELSDAISTYLSTIDKQQNRREQHWVTHIRFGLGSDSNPNYGVEDEFITIPVSMTSSSIA